MGKNILKIKVPATTANLGPGFDCLGLALDLWNTIEISWGNHQPFSIKIHGQGSDSLPADSGNLIYSSASKIAQAYARHLPDDLQIKCWNQIPTSSGLGSSASAVIAGLLAGKYILNIEIQNNTLLDLASEIEGHADNAAACLLGGLVIVVVDQENIRTTRVTIPPIHAIVSVPKVKLSTEQSRGNLPITVRLGDAVSNISRTASLVQALEFGNYEKLNGFMQDTLHQPYRYELVTFSKTVIASAINALTYGACFSGAGPGIIAFSDPYHIPAVYQAMASEFGNNGIQATTFITKNTLNGANAFYTP